MAEPKSETEQGGGSVSPKGYAFGTFKGVFTPSLLTILGVVMYLRFGWVLGNVGLGLTLVIVTLSTLITFLTGLSLSALSTNMKVGGGGAYYIISRSLGLETGAAVGLPLFFAQALGVSFYVAGFSESVVSLLPFLSPKVVGLVTLGVLTFLAVFSADLALKTQFFVLVAIALSLVSLFAGGAPESYSVPLPTEAPDKVAFWPVFAIFFPAVTGILAGVSMSGDLKDPAKSLPRGTLGAVLVSYVVYMAIPIFLSRIIRDESALLVNPLIMRDIARWGDLILVGLWGASLSSALGAMLGAPRTLQALAKDRIIPRFIARSFGRNADPRVATVLTFTIAFTGIALGDLNLIAPVLTMFSLTAYALLNLSAGFEEIIGSPSWRPSFRVHYALSLLGAFGCVGVMFMIDPGATFVAVFVCLLALHLMHRRSLRAHWGDMRYGLLMLGAQKALYWMSKRKVDERTWKPNILVLSGSPTSRWGLIELASAMTQEDGLLTVASVVAESSEDRVDKLEAAIGSFLEKQGVRAHVRVHSASDMLEGANELVRCYGFGPIEPNTILVGDTRKPENYLGYAELIFLVHKMRRNLVIFNEGDNGAAEKGNGGPEAAVEDESTDRPKTPSRVDVWWGGAQENVGLMIALAHLMKDSTVWRGAEFEIRTIVSSEAEEAEALKRLQSFIEQGRIKATPRTFLAVGKRAFSIIQEESEDASLVFLGMRHPLEEERIEDYSRYYQQLLTDTLRLPSTAFVLANENIDFRGIFTEN